MDDDKGDDDTRQQRMRRVIATAGIMVAASQLTAPIPAEPCWTSTLSGHQYIMDTLKGNENRCMSIFRMKKRVFFDLCQCLSTEHGLIPTRDIGVREMVGMFLYTVGQGVGNRAVQDRFQHSGETVHRQFNNVLNSVLSLADRIIKPRDPTFRSVPTKIRSNSRYSYFEDCIGAIDGTHIPAVVPPNARIPYIGRKGVTTQNVMAVCDFDMLFMFVCAGWERSAHDARILNEVLSNENLGFPHPPPNKYYLVDAGYPNRIGFLAPYKGERYHQELYRRVPQISGPKEAFNHVHSSLRSVIERCFGILKKKWIILNRMPSYPFRTQVRIVVACMALHNFIRMHVIDDDDFDDDMVDSVVVDEEEGIIDGLTFDGETNSSGDLQMNGVRDFIAHELWHM